MVGGKSSPRLCRVVRRAASLPHTRERGEHATTRHDSDRTLRDRPGRLRAGRSADPVNAKKSQSRRQLPWFTEPVAGEQQGAFTPAHVIGSTAVFIPTAFNLIGHLSPNEPVRKSESVTAANAHRAEQCSHVPQPALQGRDTIIGPEGTFLDHLRNRHGLFSRLEAKAPNLATWKRDAPCPRQRGIAGRENSWSEAEGRSLRQLIASLGTQRLRVFPRLIRTSLSRELSGGFLEARPTLPARARGGE